MKISKYRLHHHAEREGDIMAHQLEVRVVEQMGDVVLGAGVKDVQAEDVVALIQQPFTEV